MTGLSGDQPVIRLVVGPGCSASVELGVAALESTRNMDAQENPEGSRPSGGDGEQWPGSPVPWTWWPLAIELLLAWLAS